MGNTCTFEGLDVAADDEEKVRIEIQKIIKKRIEAGFTRFSITPTIGFNAIVVEEVVKCIPFGAQLYMTELFYGQHTVSDDWLDKLAEMTGKPYNRKKDEPTSIYDCKLGPYTVFNYMTMTDLVVVYHSIKPKSGSVLNAVIREAKKRDKPILNLFDNVYSKYKKSEYTGVRKRKGCKTWYYRIKKKMPNGIEVVKEKGGFQTAYDAHNARIEELKNITVKEEVGSVGKTFEVVFTEYIESSDNVELKRKYCSIYNTQLKVKFGDVEIGKINFYLLNDYRHDLQYFIFKEKKVRYSVSYVNAIKKLLNLVFAYAYEQGYINVHPMFGLKKTWDYKD